MKRLYFLLPLALLVTDLCAQPAWEKHVVSEGGRNLTAVAADYDGDGKIDVISSYGGKVSLFLAPDWEEVVLHELPRRGAVCIHSETLDIDGDGDMDWVGGEPSRDPFWLENPGGEGEWTARLIDADINGIHCFLKADVDKDGKLDVIVNNFKPKGVLGDSIVWFSIPENVHEAAGWERNVFAKGDAAGGSHYFGFGDIDGDGWGEIAVGAKGAPFEGGNWFCYWKNPGAGAVTEPWEKVEIASDEEGATNILPADVNGDGRMDFVASNGHGSGVFWFEAPEWEKRMIDAEMKSGHSLAVADFDGDGDVDATCCGFESERLSVYFNDGKGLFTRADLDEGQQSYDLRAVDMDGDGDMDLLNAGRVTGNVAWYENPSK